MQKRLVRKLDLERLLSQIKPHPSPKANLEQYTIPTETAAILLYLATYVHNDIIDKTVLDMGCGTGRLALGAAFLGGKQVVGIDIDKTSIESAFANSVRTGLRQKTQWITGDIGTIRGEFDTILQNPPFGVQRRGADRKFLEKALKTGKMVYSLHKSLYNLEDIGAFKANSHYIVSVAPAPFIENLVMEHDAKIKAVYAMIMAIPHMFNFHIKKKHAFVVDLYIIET